MAASFQLLVVTVTGGLAGEAWLEAARELEVRTNDFMEGVRAAERRSVVTPRMVGGMTAAGSGLNDSTDAVWMMPWTSGEVSAVRPLLGGGGC